MLLMVGLTREASDESDENPAKKARKIRVSINVVLFPSQSAFPGRNRLRRSELATTDTEENAIASPANSGLSRSQ